MAGYFLYTIDHDVFSQLATAPTQEQGHALADYLVADMEDYLDDFEDQSAAKMWSQDRDELSALIVKRLALPDWYSDLNADSARMWDHVVFALQREPSAAIGLDFQCSDYESIYWDCAGLAAKQNAAMMAEPKFGNSAFRYFGKPSRKVYDPMYSLYMPPQVEELLAQLRGVEAHFAALKDQEEGSPHEQFFEGLLPTVQNAADQRRVLWVQTDT